MGIFRPFCAVRPTKEKAKDVAALPYDVVNREEAKLIGDNNPDSFLHVDRPEMDLPDDTDLYDKAVYLKANENLKKLEENGTMIQDSSPFYYIYEQTREGKRQTGIVGCCSIDDYLNGTIKKHELTREDKEQDRIHHVDACDANTGPIFLACRYPDSLLSLINTYKETHMPIYDYIEDCGISNRVWIIDDSSTIEEISNEFKDIPSLYIADGHHRCASAVKVGLKRRNENPNYTGNEEFNYFLSIVFPYDELTILAYNRVVNDLNGLSVEGYLNKIQEYFEIEEGNEPVNPIEKHQLGMYVDEKWYLLQAKKQTYENEDVVGKLDVSILQNKVLSPILAIGDPRIDKRIQFVGGSHSLEELSSIADKTNGIAFAMYPTAMQDLMSIADENKLMPPKSTWFEPKLRSGLFIHKLK